MKNKLLALMLVGTFALTGCSLLWGEQTNSDGGGNSGEGGGDGSGGAGELEAAKLKIRFHVD